MHTWIYLMMAEETRRQVWILVDSVSGERLEWRSEGLVPDGSYLLLQGSELFSVSTFDHKQRSLH